MINAGLSFRRCPEMITNYNNKLKGEIMDDREKINKLNAMANSNPYCENDTKETIEVEELQKQEGQWNNEMNNHYKFIVKGVEIDVNDILKAIDKKMRVNQIEWSRMGFNYLSNAIEYLLRAPFKGQTESDLKKAITEIQFILNK